MLSYKEFYIWLDGFMTNRRWTVIQQIDIETIQEKMGEVKEVEPFFPNPSTIVPHRFEPVPVPSNPFKNDGYDDLGAPPKIVM
jgi:hypothetical protein